VNPRAAVRRPAAAPRRALPPRRLALVESALVVMAWLVFAYGVGKGGPLVAYDAFRDMAYAHRILAGGLGHDPSLAGMPAWYPPGDPLFFALVSRISFVPVVTLYATSVYWLGWTAPLAIFWLARGAWGRLAAWLALPCVLFGSYWWLLHAAMPMPSVQAVALALATVIAWNGAAREQGPAAVRRLATTAFLAALTTWVHPLCGAFALGSIMLHGVLAPLLARGNASAQPLALRAIAVASGGGALSLPVFFQALGVNSVNDAPRHWFAPELHEPAFALHAYAPLIWLAGLAGLAFAVRSWREHGWLVAWFAFGVLGMLSGYAGHDLRWPVPWTLPHEFQWHEQLALTLAAAFGIATLATRLARRGGAPATAGARATWALLLAALAVGPAALHIEDAGRFVTRLDAPWQAFMRVADAVSHATPGNAVVAAPPEVGYFLSGLTGRQVVALPAGHTNPLVDPAVRAAAVDSLLVTHDPERFAALVHRYQVSALLVPANALPGDSAAARLAARPDLEPIALPEPGWLAYRVRLEGGVR
jgi:hypothetical protein